MKKVLILLGILLVIFLIVGFLGINYFTKYVNAPFLIPPSKNIAQQLISAKIGSQPDIPLSLPYGYEIGVFVDNIENPRELKFSPGGTLVASLMKGGKVVALPDSDNNGVAEVKVLLEDLNLPHGIAFHNDKLFVAEVDKVVRYNFDEKSLKATFDKKLFDLPAGGRHFTRSLAVDKSGNLYVSLGSRCDTCIESDPFIAKVLISDIEGKTPQVYSDGLRNAVYLTTNPFTDEVWATEMGRDFLGDNLPPDEINIIKKGNYGWPFCYGDKIWDKTFGERNQAFCNTTIAPFYQIPAHSAPLGITFIDSPQMPKEWQGDLLVSYHGSWNRSVPTGYKIVRINTEGTPQEQDFITGFLDSSGRTLGRPTGLTFDRDGSLYIADGNSGAVYKLIKSSE